MDRLNGPTHNVRFLCNKIYLIINQSSGYEMTGHSRDPKDHYPMSFYNVIEPADHPMIDQTFERLTVEKKAAHFEFRLTRRWINIVGSKSVEEPTWLLGLAVPQLNEDGSVKSIMGVQADISKLKWAESLQMRSRIEAEEGTVPVHTVQMSPNQDQ